MDAAVVASIIVSAIAALATWLASRQSTKAAMTNTVTSSRVEMEKEAYERARKLDTDTIIRQDAELKELEEKYDKLEGRANTLQTANLQLYEDIERISRDNYQLSRQNQQIIEQNSQVIAENKRLREIGERAMRDNQTLQTDVMRLRERVTKLQRGINTDSTLPIRERETDTNPMGDYRNGGE